MKKRILSHLLICIITCILVVPFSIVKAGTSLVNSTSGSFNATNNTTAGYYYVYTAIASSGSYLQFYFNDKIYDYDQYHSASITDIQMNDSYDGYLTLSFTSSANLTSKLVFVESDGACSMNYGTQAINLTLNDCTHITVYVFTTDSTANNIQPNTITPTLQKSSTNINFDPVLENQIIQRWFPNCNLVGYLWGISYGAYITNQYDANIPVVYIPAGNNSYDQMHRLVAKANSTTIFYFYCSWWLESSRYRVLYDNPNVNYETSIEIVQQPGAVNIGNYSPYYLTKFTIINPTNDNRRFELEFTGNVYVTPIYFGDANQIPDDLALMLQIDYNNTYTRLLQDIVNALSTNSNTPTNPSTDLTQANNDLNTVSQNIENFESTITTDFYNNMNNINLNDYNIFSQLSDTSYYFKTYINDFFNHIGDFKALFIVPIIVTVLMLIVGWVV